MPTKTEYLRYLIRLVDTGKELKIAIKHYKRSKSNPAKLKLIEAEMEFYIVLDEIEIKKLII